MSQKITWLIPVKNGMPFIRETLASLAAQTLPADEVLVWDNGSTDGTVDEVRQWISNRLPGRIIIGQPLPLAESLAKLVESARNEFCARIDADDVARADRSQLQAATLEDNQEVAAIGCRFDPIDQDGKPCEYNYWLPVEYSDILHGLFINNCLLHPGMMFRRSAVLAAGNYRMASPVEDYDLWLRLVQRGKIIARPEPLIRYRVRPDSVTAAHWKAQNMNEAIDYAWLANVSGFAGLSPASALRLRRCCTRWVDWYLWRAHRKFRKRDGLSYGRRLKTESFRKVVARYKV